MCAGWWGGGGVGITNSDEGEIMTTVFLCGI